VREQKGLLSISAIALAPWLLMLFTHRYLITEWKRVMASKLGEALD
jgi:hypothetical protein